ncbi:MAG: FeoC-like transcriptional regulator [Crocosphaera sp.]|nr:FeoC-like transcriptional regulator [Crocosphaera sp.]
MILTDIQTYLQQYGKASLSELTIHFRIDADALRPLLKKLIRKKRIRLILGKKCESCCHCPPESIEFYEWIT